MKERYTKIVNTRLFYLVFSFITAFALWAYVGYSENNDEAVSINNVAIEYINEELLEENNLVLTNCDLSSINLKISGKRNTVMGLNNRNVYVRVDLGEIVSVAANSGTYQLRWEIVYPNGTGKNDVSVASASSDYVTVTVEKLVTVTRVIEAIYDGGPAEGFSAQPVELSANRVTISGPESIVSQIAKVEARFTANNFSEEFSCDVPLSFLDAEGNPISTDDLSLDYSSVTAVIPVIMVKEVVLDVTFTSCNSAGYSNVSYTIDPPVLTLAGDADVLKDINVINLGTIDLTSFNSTYTDTFAIRIPNGVTNVTGTSTATVSVNITGVEITKLSVTNISYKNETTGLYYKIITQSLDVTLRGSAASIAAIEPNNIRIVADLSELGTATGRFDVPPKIYVDGYPDVDAIIPGSITVNILVSDQPFPAEEDAAAAQ